MGGQACPLPSAGLPVCGSIVGVAPPLSASGLSLGSANVIPGAQGASAERHWIPPPFDATPPRNVLPMTVAFLTPFRLT